jgi:hypothetical protein
VNLSKAKHEQTLHLTDAWCQVRNTSPLIQRWLTADTFQDIFVPFPCCSG